MFNMAFIQSENVFKLAAEHVLRRGRIFLTSQEVIISITNIRWIYSKSPAILSMFQQQGPPTLARNRLPEIPPAAHRRFLP